MSPDISWSRGLSPDPKLHPFKLAKPFLHPTVSRLRSFTPQSSRAASNEDSTASHQRPPGGVSPSLSHLSSISRRSSISHLLLKRDGEPTTDKAFENQEVFKWTDLHVITQAVYSKASQKASTLLGAPMLGSPTVLAANGLICIGTTEGKVAVYDFKQTLLCVCDSNMPGTFLFYTNP